MPVDTLISSDGQFDATCLRTIPTDHDENVSVVTAVGAYGLRQADFLNAVFETSFPSSSDGTPVTGSLVRGHDSAIMAEPPRHLYVMNVSPFDGPDVDQDDERELAWHLSLSLSNTVLFTARMNDLARPQSNGLAAIQASLTQMLILQADNVVPTPPTGKRCFLTIVKDYEADVLSRQDIVSGFMQEMETVYSKVAKPSRSPTRITDLFDFEFALFPSETLASAEYTSALEALKQRLVDPTADDYLFENGGYARDSAVSVADAAEQAWNRMDKDRTQDMPPKKDLMSAFDCGNAMRKVFDKYQASIRVWSRETDGGVIIDKFGEAASEMVKSTIAAYEQDAAAYKGSTAFKRKRDELKDLLDADLYNLFVVQIAKLREVTYRMFKEKLDEIDEGEPRLDKEVHTVLKECQKAFRENAQALRPTFAGWRYDNDVKELGAKMREEATDKLQRARLADYQEGGGRRGRRRRAAIASVAPKKRQPISLGIHYLDPAPFGFKDSRYEKLNVDDSMAYNTDVPLFDAESRNSGGLSVPLAPSRNSGWQRSNQDFIYTERK